MSEFKSWQELLDFLTKSAVKRKTIEGFSTIKNDNAKRAQFLLEDENVREALTDWMNKLLGNRGRDLSTSKFHRQEGNHLFSIKDYILCIETYTLSINTCPSECLEELSLAYANRSAALFHLGLYEDCIKDIEMALKNGYPPHLCPKVLLRKMKCFQKLGKMESFQSSLEQLEDAMKNLQLGEQKRLEKEIQTVVSSPTEKENLIEPPAAGLPQLLNGSNTEILHTSAALEIRYSGDKGRYIVANTDIKAGDTLFIEAPSACVVLPDFHGSRCHHCTKAFVQRYPCLGCGLAWFCSKECRNLSESYHTTECGLLPLLYSIGIAHLGFRIVLMFGLETLLEYHNNTELKAKVPGVDSSYGRAGYDILFHLVSHTETMAAEELYQYALTAALLTMVLECRCHFFGNDASAKYIVGGHLLIHICQMVCNAHAITELCTTDDSNQSTVSERQERVATAIYPSASLMNHSCNPTVINSFVGNYLIVRAVKDVPTGGEVFNCYGPHFRRMTRMERQEALSAQYSFTCRCESCLDVHSEDFQDVIQSFQCPSCKGPLVSPKSSNPGDGQKALCRSCRQLQDYFPQLRSDLEALSLDARGSEAMELGDITQAVKHLSKCVQLRRSALYKAHPDLGRSADKLAQCYAFLGQYEECARFLRVSMGAVEDQYGRYSIEMANELQKFTDVLMELAKERRDPQVLEELERYLKEAALIYEIHYGVWSKSYKEIGVKICELNSLRIS